MACRRPEIQALQNLLDLFQIREHLARNYTEGDRQSPEGFYSVGHVQMNPWSDFHLAFNLGYPNEYDRAYNRSGSALMIHGRCSSDGCFAMTDYHMDEIYTLAHAALEGQPGSVSGTYLSTSGSVKKISAPTAVHHGMHSG